MAFDIEEFRQYLDIDKHALDDMLKEQPNLLFEISDAYEQAMGHRDTLKEALTIIEAELDAHIREDYEKNGDKLTEPQLKALIAADGMRKKAYAAYAAARERANRLSALKDAFKERGWNIRALCDLFTSNYFESASARSTSNTDAAAYKTLRQRAEASRSR